MNNGRDADPLVEMSPRLDAWAGQTSNNSTFVEKGHQVESLEDVAGAYLSERDQGVGNASTLRKPIEMYSQHARPEKISVKMKPNISLRRDPPILSNRTVARESLQNVRDSSTDMSKQPHNSMSSEKKRIRLPKHHKEEVQECKKQVGCNGSLTKIRSSKDVSSRASTQQKPHNFSRSLSPALIVEQRSQQVSSKERSTKDYKHCKPELDGLRQNQQLLKQVSSGAKSTNTSATASKSKLEHCHIDDRDNNNVIDKTYSGVSRVEDLANSAASCQNDSRGNRHQAQESLQLQSPVSVASSRSDTYVCDSNKQIPQSVGRARKTAPHRSTTEQRRENQAEFLRKANFDEKVDTHNKSDNNDNLSGDPRSSISRRDLRPEAQRSSHKVRHDVDQRMRNYSLSGIAVAQQQISRDRKFTNSLKWNASVKTTNTNKYNDKLKNAGKRVHGFPKDCMEEYKQDKKPAMKLHTKMHNSTSDSFSSSHSFSEQGEGKFATLVKTKHRTGKTENNISDWSMHGCSYKKEKKTESRSINAERHMYTVFDQAGPSSNLVSLETLVQSVSAEQSFSPRGRDDLRNKAGFKPDVAQCDILPVIYFCWQKCTDSRSEEGSSQQDLQQVLSLDQGLSVFRQIMLDATSGDTVYSQEYTLNQLIIKGNKPLATCDVINSNNKEIARGICFQLTPKIKRIKSNTIIWSSESTSSSTLSGLFNGNSAYLSQESRQAMLLQNKGDAHPLSPALGEALCSINDIHAAINISKTIKSSIQRRLNMASLWSSVTRGIIAFFLYPLEKPSITYSRLCADVEDNNGTTVDEINSFLDKGHSIENIQPQEQANNEAVVSSELFTPVADQQPASLEQVINEQRKSPNADFIAEKRQSEDKTTVNSDTSSTDEPDSVCAGSTMNLKSFQCKKKKASVQESVYLNMAKSVVDFSNACNKCQMNTFTNKMDVYEQPQRLPEHTSVVTHTCTASSQLVQHRLESGAKGTTISENFKMNTNKECSQYIHSNTRIVKSIRSENTERNEMNNIPFSTHMYESLEGHQTKLACDNACGQQNGVAYRRYENEELEFVGTSENCPDPSLEDVEDTTDSQSTASLSGYGSANRRQHPHLMWTMRYGQSMLDSGEQTHLESTCCTSNERAEVNDGNRQPHPTEKGKCNAYQDDPLHTFSVKDHVREQVASADDASITGFNCSIGTEGLCQDACHSRVSQRHAPLVDDVKTISGSDSVRRPHTTSSDVLTEVTSQEGSSVKEYCFSLHKQSLSTTDGQLSVSPSKTNEEIKWWGNIKDASLSHSVCSHNFMGNSKQYDKTTHINHVDSRDNDATIGTEYSDISYREDANRRCTIKDTVCLCKVVPNAEDTDRDRKHDDYMSETHSRINKTTDASQPAGEHAVNILIEGSSDLDRVTLNTGCKHDTSDVTVEVNVHNSNFPDNPAIHNSPYETQNTITGSFGSPNVLSSHRELSVNNISTEDNINSSGEGSISFLATSNQNLQWFSIDSITRAALALKEVSASRMSYLCSSQTATACSYLIRAGCSSQLGDTLSNLISTQQLSRYDNNRKLDQCGSSVDDSALNCKTEGFIENHTYIEDKQNVTLNNSIENGNMDNNLPTSTVYVGENIRNENVNATITNDSPAFGDVHQENQDTMRQELSLTELSDILPEMTGLNNAKTDTIELPTSVVASVYSMSTGSNNTRSNDFSNSSQKEGNKGATSELHLSRITDLLNPNACQSDEGQESGIFSNYSLASPPVPQTTDLDNVNSSLESFDSIFTKNSVYLKEQTSRDDTATGQSTAY